MLAKIGSCARTPPVLHPAQLSHRQRVMAFASPVLTEVHLKAEPITEAAFQPFGQLITAIDDMKSFDHEDAQLDLSQGVPRFYIMRLPAKPAGLSFTSITHHKAVTQCLGSLTPDSWYMAVAEAGVERPRPEDLKVFKVPFGSFIKMNKSTWHAGPHFVGHEHMDFYNLELADTNQVDHHSHHFDQADGLRICINS